MSEVQKTPEQLEAERLAAEQKAADDAAAKAEKARVAQEKKDQKAAEKKATQELKAAERLKAKEEKATAEAAKKAEREASKLEKNGITRPLTGATKQIWDLADKISGETQAPATRAAVLEQGLAAGLQNGTINTQYGRWRKYHGLTVVREAKPKAPEVPQAPAAPVDEAPSAE